MTSLDAQYPNRNESPGFLLWRVSNLWQQQIRKALKPHELTHVQFVLLAVLTSEATPLTQNELAAIAGTDRMMTSQVVRVLEQRGLVQRKPDETDKRAMRITATRNGRTLANRAVAVVEAVDAQFFSAITPTQRAALIGLLQRETK